MHPLTPLTSYLTFGPISTGGDVTVKLIYDHRVMDDRTVARAMAALEETLDTELTAEVREWAWSGLGRERAYPTHRRSFSRPLMSSATAK
jgi:hypothetical protein